MLASGEVVLGAEFDAATGDGMSLDGMCEDMSDDPL